MRRTPVYIICSPRPLVGKTLIARLLCEFLLLQRGGVVGFDVNLKEPSLLDYLPKVTETADVIDTFGKMQLMDRLIANDGVAKVIDLGFHAFDEFFKMCDEIGFMGGKHHPAVAMSRERGAARPRACPKAIFWQELKAGWLGVPTTSNEAPTWRTNGFKMKHNNRCF